MKLLRQEQIIKSNHIDNYMYGIEIQGPHEIVFEQPYEPKRHIIILVLKGTIDIEINSEEQEFRQGQMLNIPIVHTIGKIKYNSDFHGIIITAASDVLMDIFRNRTPFPFSFSYRFREVINSPELSRKESKIIAGDMRNLIGVLGNKTHHYLNELAYAHFYILLTDIADIIWSRYGEGEPERSTEISRSDSLLKDFLKLAADKSERESNIDFYSDTLCVSRQYLSMIVKKKIGVPVGEYIADMRYEKAIKLIKDTKLTLQQIADMMNFSDQSSFGKFFKRHCGQSPQMYRKSLKKNLLTGHIPIEIPENPSYRQPLLTK